MPWRFPPKAYHRGTDVFSGDDAWRGRSAWPPSRSPPWMAYHRGALAGGWSTVSACMARSTAAIRRRLGSATVPCDVAEASAAQTPPRHPASRHAMREGEAVETSVAELRGDLLRSPAVASAAVWLNQRRSRSRLMMWQNLPPSLSLGAKTHRRDLRRCRTGARPSIGRVGRPCTN
jgi:hypothetical protein